MPQLQLCPRLVSPALLRMKQVTIACRRLRAFGELSIDPVGILAGPWQRDLELVRSAMPIPSIEGVAIDLTGGKLLQPIEKPKARQLTRLRAQTGSQRIRRSVADEALQAASAW